MRVELVFDFPCVWSYFAYGRFRRVAPLAELVFRPHLLAPEATVAGEPKVDVLRRTFGADVDEAIVGIESLAVAEGLRFRYRDAVWSNTLAAHRLVAVAAGQGLADPMVERLFRAHHTDGLNIADPGVLDALAAEIGVVDRGQEVLVEPARVRVVPVFRFADGRALTGAPSEAELHRALAV